MSIQNKIWEALVILVIFCSSAVFIASLVVYTHWDASMYDIRTWDPGGRFFYLLFTVILTLALYIWLRHRPAGTTTDNTTVNPPPSTK